MSIKFIVAHRKDPNNVGDIASNPLQYFLKESEYQSIDVANLGQEVYPTDIPLIVGGGGLIGNDFFGDFFNDLLESSDRLQLEKLWSETWITADSKYESISKEFHTAYQDLISRTLEKIDKVTAPRAVWGAGHNGPDATDFSSIRWPRALAKYKLVGLRDYDPGSRFNWVPCASCMHPALRKNYTIKNDVIWFEHKKQLIKDFGKDTIPRFINSGDNVEQTIELLGSANIILTNSYHGAYWGILLKKKVIVVGGAWSSKFNFFKHKPFILGKKDYWRDVVDQATIYNHALDECVAATEDYWNKIKRL